MSGISTHVLDVSRGVAAAGIGVRLERADGPGEPDRWREVSRHMTDADGRVKSLLPTGVPVEPGVYRLRFETGAYWSGLAVACFHPIVDIVFSISDQGRHHHVPLLVSPFGFTTYRGT